MADDRTVQGHPGDQDAPAGEEAPMARRGRKQNHEQGPADFGWATFIVVFLITGFVVNPVVYFALGAEEYQKHVSPWWSPFLVALVVAVLAGFLHAMLSPSRNWAEEAARIDRAASRRRRRRARRNRGASPDGHDDSNREQEDDPVQSNDE